MDMWGSSSCSGPTVKVLTARAWYAGAVCAVTGRNLFSEGLRVTNSMYCASESKLGTSKSSSIDRNDSEIYLRFLFPLYLVLLGPDCLTYSKKIPYSQRRAGDAVFFCGACDCASSLADIHHVGLMVDSGTKMWNALKTGTVVREDDFGSWGEKPCPYVIRF
jgi:hypothetical protein